MPASHPSRRRATVRGPAGRSTWLLHGNCCHLCNATRTPQARPGHARPSHPQARGVTRPTAVTGPGSQGAATPSAEHPPPRRPQPAQWWASRPKLQHPQWWPSRPKSLYILTCSTQSTHGHGKKVGPGRRGVGGWTKKRGVWAAPRQPARVCATGGPWLKPGALHTAALLRQ